MKFLIVLAVVGLVVAGVVLYYHFSPSQENSQTKQYQGPVPQGYNETHFRKTGETIPLENGRNK